MAAEHAPMPQQSAEPLFSVPPALVVPAVETLQGTVSLDAKADLLQLTPTLEGVIAQTTVRLAEVSDPMAQSAPEGERIISVTIGAIESKGDRLEPDVGLALSRALRAVGIIVSPESSAHESALSITVETRIEEREHSANSYFDSSSYQRGRSTNQYPITYRSSVRSVHYVVSVTVVARRGGSKPFLEEGVGRAAETVLESRINEVNGYYSEQRGRPERSLARLEERVLAQAVQNVAPKIAGHLRTSTNLTLPTRPVTVQPTEPIPTTAEASASPEAPGDWELWRGTIDSEAHCQAIDAWLRSGRMAPVYTYRNLLIAHVVRKIGLRRYQLLVSPAFLAAMRGQTFRIFVPSPTPLTQ